MDFDKKLSRLVVIAGFICLFLYPYNWVVNDRFSMDSAFLYAFLLLTARRAWIEIQEEELK